MFLCFYPLQWSSWKTCHKISWCIWYLLALSLFMNICKTHLCSKGFFSFVWECIREYKFFHFFVSYGGSFRFLCLAVGTSHFTEPGNWWGSSQLCLYHFNMLFGFLFHVSKSDFLLLICYALLSPEWINLNSLLKFSSYNVKPAELCFYLYCKSCRYLLKQYWT